MTNIKSALPNRSSKSRNEPDSQQATSAKWDFDMANRLVTCACICGTLAIAAPFCLGNEPPRSRRAFAQAINKVNEGMPEAEVVALLGKPDAVSTEESFEVKRINHARAIWRYGVSGRRKAATLGEICIDDKHQVQYISGQGTPPPNGVFTEPELRRLLEALYDLPSYQSSYRYNPRPVIRAVNLLQPLGKEKALAAVDEFLRVSFDFTDETSREGVFLLLRTLFDVPTVPTVFNDAPLKSGYMPPLLGGADAPIEKLLPRFPIAIEGDIPFLLVEGYNIEGQPEPPESHVAYFRKYGRLRAKPLIPTPKPFDALHAFETSPRWHFKTKKEDPFDPDTRERILLGNQVLNLLDTVFRVEPDSMGLRISFDAEEQNKRVVAEASKLAIRWDSKASKYTFLDGTSLPELNPNRYRELFWKPTLAGLKVELDIQRESRRYVGVGLSEYSVAGKPSPPGVIRVFNVKAKGTSLYEFKTRDMMGGMAATGTTIRLDEGAEIQAELLIDGKKLQESPVFKP